MIIKLGINAENILVHYPHCNADGKGKITIKKVATYNSTMIIVALSALGIEFEKKLTRVKGHSSFEFTFEINDIRLQCPMLYEKWHEMDDRVKYHSSNQLNHLS